MHRLLKRGTTVAIGMALAATPQHAVAQTTFLDPAIVAGYAELGIFSDLPITSITVTKLSGTGCDVSSYNVTNFGDGPYDKFLAINFVNDGPPNLEGSLWVEVEVVNSNNETNSISWTQDCDWAG
jgi:hypothetical protein